MHEEELKALRAEHADLLLAEASKTLHQDTHVPSGAAAGQEVGDLKQKLENKREQVAALTVELEARDRRIEEQQADVAESASRVEALMHEVERKQITMIECVTQHCEELKTAEDRCSRASIEIAEKEKKLSSLQNQIELLEGDSGGADEQEARQFEVRSSVTGSWDRGNEFHVDNKLPTIFEEESEDDRSDVGSASPLKPEAATASDKPVVGAKQNFSILSLVGVIVRNLVLLVVIILGVYLTLEKFDPHGTAFAIDQATDVCLPALGFVNTDDAGYFKAHRFENSSNTNFVSSILGACRDSAGKAPDEKFGADEVKNFGDIIMSSYLDLVIVSGSSFIENMHRLLEAIGTAEQFGINVSGTSAGAFIFTINNDYIVIVMSIDNPRASTSLINNSWRLLETSGIIASATAFRGTCGIIELIQDNFRITS